MGKALVRQGSVIPDKRATLVAHLVAESILGRVLPTLAAAGIEALPVKGVVTAHELYDDVSERPITDIDLRVLPERLGDVASIAVREGWELLRYSKPYQNVVFRMDGFTVDVETSVGPPGLCALGVDQMLARSTRGAGRGFAHSRPELHDHAVLLCVNAFKDKLTYAAPWAIRDLERIVARRDFEPDRFISLARASNVLGLAWIVADWMATARENVLWGDVRARIGNAPRPLYSRLLRMLVRRDDNSLALRLLTRAGADSPRAQAHALFAAFRWEINAQLKRRT